MEICSKIQDWRPTFGELAYLSNILTLVNNIISNPRPILTGALIIDRHKFNKVRLKNSFVHQSVWNQMGSLISDPCLSSVLIFVTVFSCSILSSVCCLWCCKWSSYYVRQIHSDNKSIRKWMIQSIIILPSIHGFGSCILDCVNVKIEQSNCWVLLEHETHFATIKLSCILLYSFPEYFSHHLKCLWCEKAHFVDGRTAFCLY